MILFIHQNFPAQFGGVGAYLSENGWDVTFATARREVIPPADCRIMHFSARRAPAMKTHRYLHETERAVLNGQGFARAAIAAAAAGYRPDLVVAHSGWGSGTFAKSVWPDVPLVTYSEWFYSHPAIDRPSTEPADEMPEDERARNLVRNAPFLLDAVQSDLILCPTYFQAARFPEDLRRRITVMHDGVDCVANAPAKGKRMRLPGLDLSNAEDIITFATNALEPHRGFPEFMASLALLQKIRPGLHAVIAGEDRVIYGSRLPEGESWKRRMLTELDLDLDRVHFTGMLAAEDLRTLFQTTSLHVYFTVPFVLSWSLVEAMSCAAPILASDVDPVREVLEHGVSARLVDHRRVKDAAAAMNSALNDRAGSAELGARARQTALQRFDTRWIYPAKAELFRTVAIGSRDAAGRFGSLVG